jgi:hypothetical protein
VGSDCVVLVSFRRHQNDTVAPWRASGAATRNPDMAIFWPFMSRLQISVFLLRREIVLTGVSIYQE